MFTSGLVPECGVLLYMTRLPTISNMLMFPSPHDRWPNIYGYGGLTLFSDDWNAMTIGLCVHLGIVRIIISRVI